MSIKDEIEDDLEDVIEKLKEERDELRVRIHLANMEMRDEWEELEKKWDQFVVKSGQVRTEVEPTVQEIKSALSLLGEEIAKGYRKIKDAI
jgi:hypothetical protein